MTPAGIITSIIGGYLCLNLLLAVFAYRRAKVSLEDFLLYERRAGFFVLYLTVVSTFFSAFAFLGSSGFIYTHGIGFSEASIWVVLSGFVW